MSWKSARLSELCREGSPITYGILQPGPEVENGVPYIRPSEIKGGRIDIPSIRRTSHAIADRYEKSRIQEGDILITIVGTIGHIATVPSDLDGGNITQSSARIRICPSKAHSGYVKNFLRSPGAARQYDQNRLGVAVARLNLHHVRDLQIPLPSLSEQKRIAEILDVADALRAKRRESLAQLDALVQSTFLDTFGDPVTNPMGWETPTLGEVVKVRSGNGLVAKDMAPDGDFPVYGGNGINGYHDAYMFEEPTIILGRVGVYCGVVHLTKPKAWVTDNALYIREFLQPIDPAYLVESLKIANLNQYANQAAQPLISGGRIYPVTILLPPLDLQHRFASIVKSIEQQKASHQAHLSELDTLFASLQHRAFNGQL